MKAILALLLAAGLLAAGASASDVRWDETAKDGKVPVMGFRVDRVTFGKRAWSAHVTFRNLSTKPIRIGNRFGAAIFADGRTEDLSRAIGFAYALTFSPARPTVLAPGASWTGTIGGDGQLKASTQTRWVRIVFGPLGGLPGQKSAVFWVTDHALALPPTRPASPGVI